MLLLQIVGPPTIVATASFAVPVAASVCYICRDVTVVHDDVRCNGLRSGARRVHCNRLDHCADAYLKLVPHSEYANVSDAAHMVAGDRNDIFVAAVLEFLSDVAPAK